MDISKLPKNQQKLLEAVNEFPTEKAMGIVVNLIDGRIDKEKAVQQLEAMRGMVPDKQLNDVLNSIKMINFSSDALATEAE